MARQERMAKKADCPRCGVGKMHTGSNAVLNPKSVLTGTQICEECKIEEIFGMVNDDQHAEFLGEENVL